uniref:Peptidase S74 domain-containing protein n=1 Tax=Pyrodinium bahamense TaxID=73915 RepID=A0A7S0AW37_9DINO
MSLLGAAHLGASLALRGFARLGKSLSVLDYVELGSSLSVRSFLRFGSALAESTINFGNTHSYAKYVSSPASSIELYVEDNRGLSVTSTGGVLHGTWTSDGAVTTSDRRLKKSIVPLYKALAESANKVAPGSQRPAGTERASAVGWVLRQLRPVSFKFKHGPEGKHSRYGFVAQELQQVLPSVVRGQGDKHLSVVYQDLIALLTLATQVLQDKLNQQEESIAAMMKYMKTLDEKIESLLAKQRQENIEQEKNTLTQHIQELEKKLEYALLKQAHGDKRAMMKPGKDYSDVEPEHIDGWPTAVQV